MKSFKEYLNERIELPKDKASLNIDRKDMPQIESKDLNDFKEFLKTKGVTTGKEVIDPNKLIATQRHFHIAKIEGIITKMKDGSYVQMPIIVSKDNYVLDGHHRWLAHKNTNSEIEINRIEVNCKELLDLMKEYPKSFYKKLHESFDSILTESGDVCPVITRDHMKAFEKLVDRLFAKFKIDFDFTSHFRERMSDGRNNPCIDMKELASMIQKIYKTAVGGKNILSKYPDTEAVIMDMQSDLNMPVAIEYDRRKDELRVATKTIMRKKNFKSPDRKIKV